MSDCRFSIRHPLPSTHQVPRPYCAADRVRWYFARRYPRRKSGIASKLFRQGESDRLHLVRTWIPNWDGLAVLDAGCGDGAFMHSLLNGRPAHLRLEDFAHSWAAMAHERLLNEADKVEAVLPEKHNRGQ